MGTHPIELEPSPIAGRATLYECSNAVPRGWVPQLFRQKKKQARKWRFRGSGMVELPPLSRQTRRARRNCRGIVGCRSPFMSSDLQTMKTILLKGNGGFDQLEYREDVLVPVPAAGEVLIRVGAAICHLSGHGLSLYLFDLPEAQRPKVPQF